MERWRRSAIVLIGFVEALIFSGCLFGWSSLLHVLQQEGVYSHLCTEPHENGITATSSEYSQDYFHSSTEINSIAMSARLWVDHNDATNNSLRESLSTTQNEFKNDEASKPLNDIIGTGTPIPVWSSRAGSDSDHNYNEEQENSTTISYDEDTLIVSDIPKCNLQTMEMTLIYTVSAVLYGLTSVLIGFALDLCGLWFTRILGSMMTTGGFICLAFTSKETSWLLWPALNLIALGTNQLRLSSYQFANLWPQHRTTVLIAYSSAYSISTTMFLLIQYGHGAQIPYKTICLILVGVSLLTFPSTLILPVMRTEEHIEIEFEPSSKIPNPNPNPNSEKLMQITSDDDEDTLPRIMRTNGYSKNVVPIDHFDEEERSIYQETTINEEVPLGSSLWTVSALLHIFWAFINLFLLLFYSATFIPWLQKMTNDPRLIEHYNEICGVCALIAPIFIPIAGLVTDWQIRKASALEDPIERLALTMQAPAFTMAIATLFLLGTMICKILFTREAVYISIALIAISRPFIVGSCTSYVRIRFHPTHFNRLNGIFMTLISAMCMVQYPIILWMKRSTEDFLRVQFILIFLLVLSLISPGHLMFKRLARKYAQSQLKFRTEM